MAANKTQPTSQSVRLFLDGIEDDQKRNDSWQIYKIMERLTGKSGILWGTSIIGFGNYHYKYKSGREGDWFLTGFSPRKNALTLYLMCDISHQAFDFKSLGKYKKGKGCLYIKKLEHVNLTELEKIIKTSIELTKKQS
ncbi:MAG: DUF1801 domain-containing protein [Flavobacteriaceae bacterium]